MDLTVLAIAVLVVAGMMMFGLKQNNRWQQTNLPLPYRRRPMLCNKTERQFLGCLIMAVGDEFLIMPKVRLADLVLLEPGLKAKIKRLCYEKISRDHVDYVLCHKHNTGIVCAIDLYDPKNATLSRKQQVKFLDQVFKTAELPLIRFPVKEEYRVKEVEHAIEQCLQHDPYYQHFLQNRMAPQFSATGT